MNKNRCAIVPSEKGQGVVKTIGAEALDDGGKKQPAKMPGESVLLEDEEKKKPKLRIVQLPTPTVKGEPEPEALSKAFSDVVLYKSDVPALLEMHWELHHMYLQKSEGVAEIDMEGIVNTHAKVVDRLWIAYSKRHPYPPDSGLDEASGDFEGFAANYQPVHTSKLCDVTSQAAGTPQISQIAKSLETINPYRIHPTEDVEHNFAIHHHWCGKSMHADLLIRLDSDAPLLNWEMHTQGESKEQHSIDTVPLAKNSVAASLVDWSKVDWPSAQIACKKKATVPVGWLDAEGVTKNLEPAALPIGGNAEHPGVYHIADRGTVEFGAQANGMHEYFVHGKTASRKLLFCKQEDGTWGCTGNHSPTPYVLTAEAVNKSYMPPGTASALPKVIREQVPDKYKYWLCTVEKAESLRNSLYRAICTKSLVIDFHAPYKREIVVKDGVYKAEVQLGVAIIKVDQEKRLVYGIVLEPEEVDAQKDIVSAVVIEKAAHSFMSKYNQETKLGLMHTVFGNIGIELVESYIAPQKMKLGKESVKKGSWLMVTRVISDTVWKQVKSKKLTGYSIAGVATVASN